MPRQTGNTRSAGKSRALRVLQAVKKTDTKRSSNVGSGASCEATLPPPRPSVKDLSTQLAPGLLQRMQADSALIKTP
jgi:hypothetical protein